MGKNFKEFFLNIFFPKLCLICQKEGNYLCSDCQALFEISQNRFCLCLKPKILEKGGKCSGCQFKKLDGLYFALNYQNSFLKKLIQQFKYPPFIKELAKPLSSLIITHFQLLEKKPDFSNFILIPIPLNEKRLRWRGFNQAAKIAKELSKILEIPLILDCLMRVKNNFPQVELTGEIREENVKGIFSCQKIHKILGRKILLVDDVYTTGATMEEAAKVLKESEAKKVIGVVIARAKSGEDKL